MSTLPPSDHTRVIPRTDSLQRAYRAQGADETELPRPQERTAQFSPITWVLIFFTALVGIAGIAFMAMSKPGAPEGTEDASEPTVTTMIRVPNVQYESLYMARTIADRAHLIIEPEYVDGDEDYPPDTVLDQEPKPGETLPEHGTLRVWVSRVAVEDGQSAEVPDVSGMSFERAADEMAEAGLAVARMDQADEEIPEGYVIRQNPEPEAVVPNDTEVTLFVSTGPRQEFDPTDMVIDGRPDDGPGIEIIPDDRNDSNPDETPDAPDDGQPDGPDTAPGDPEGPGDTPDTPETGDDSEFGRGLIDLVPDTAPEKPVPEGGLQRTP